MDYAVFLCESHEALTGKVNVQGNLFPSRAAERRLRTAAPMRSLDFSVTLLLLLALVACTPGDGGYSEADGDGVTAVKVFDGDSLIVSDAAGRQIEVRLYGIDAPERGQAYSNKAKQALQGLLGRHALRMEIVEIDRYGRTVAVLYRANGGDSINSEMVGRGFAWVYRRYNKDAAMLALEDRARQDRAGLWADRDTPVAPWNWRRDARQNR